MADQYHHHHIEEDCIALTAAPPLAPRILIIWIVFHDQ